MLDMPLLFRNEKDLHIIIYKKHAVEWLDWALIIMIRLISKYFYQYLFCRYKKKDDQKLDCCVIWKCCVIRKSGWLRVIIRQYKKIIYTFLFYFYQKLSPKFLVCSSTFSWGFIFWSWACSHLWVLRSCFLSCSSLAWCNLSFSWMNSLP